MANHRAIGHRGAVVAPDVPARLSVACPTCEATPGTRCFRLNSWIDDPERPEGGYYTDRLDAPHKLRRTGARPGPAPLSDRGALRREISRLAGLKLGGSARMNARQWANSSRRTDQELADKVAALSAMTDVVPSTRLPHQRGR